MLLIEKLVNNEFDQNKMTTISDIRERRIKYGQLYLRHKKIEFGLKNWNDWYNLSL